MKKSTYKKKRDDPNPFVISFRLGSDSEDSDSDSSWLPPHPETSEGMQLVSYLCSDGILSPGSNEPHTRAIQ